MNEGKLGRTKYTLSKIGLGTVQFGVDYGFTKKKSQEEVNDILNCAIDNGVNFIDTAREYGDSEKKIGTFISENTNNLIIATKLKKISADDDLSFNALKGTMFKSVEDSLTDLKLKKLDMLQLHQTDEYLISNRYFWRIIDQLKTEELIGSFGVSVYEVNETKRLLCEYNNLIDFFQVPFNVFDQRFSTLEGLISEYSIGIISRSTYLKGIIPCDLDKMPSSMQDLKPYKIKLKKISEALSMSVEEVALLYVYQNKLVSSTILGVDSAEELKANIKAINKYSVNILNGDALKELCVNDSRLVDPRRWSDF